MAGNCLRHLFQHPRAQAIPTAETQNILKQSNKKEIVYFLFLSVTKDQNFAQLFMVYVIGALATHTKEKQYN